MATFRFSLTQDKISIPVEDSHKRNEVSIYKENTCLEKFRIEN